MSRRARAFTLPEVLATLLLVGVVLPVCMRAISTSMSASASARHQLEAGQLARSKLDELLVLRDRTTFDSSGDFGEGWPDYRWRSSGMIANLTTYEVTVTVEWAERGQTRSLSMTTLIYPPSTTVTVQPGGEQ